MVEPDSIVVKQLRAIRGDASSRAKCTMRVELTAVRQHMAGMLTIQEHDHTDIAGINSRLNRIEKRLELAD